MKIGYQMFSAREIIKDAASMKFVLKQLSEMGYDGVEFFLYHNVPARELREMLDEFHLEAIGTHVHLNRWEADTQGEIQYAADAGIPYLVYPWIAPELRTEDFYRHLPAELSRLSALCGEKGIRLQYHNHDFEFAKQNGRYVLDWILKENQSVQIELDTFWTWYSGVDAVEYMKKYDERMKMIHVKDYLGLESDPPEFCAVGTGKLDNAEVIQAAEAMDKEWVIVELDNSPLDPMESARISVENIKNILKK